VARVHPKMSGASTGVHRDISSTSCTSKRVQRARRSLLLQCVPKATPVWAVPCGLSRVGSPVWALRCGQYRPPTIPAHWRFVMMESISYSTSDLPQVHLWPHLRSTSDPSQIHLKPISEPPEAHLCSQHKHLRSADCDGISNLQSLSGVWAPPAERSSQKK